jgi:predicted short-subunit dehydrogenase-like oxidoreductase (DUF2520 family)
MAKLKKQHIVIIGCGNVAWHLAKHLSELNKFEITIYNHKANTFLNEFKTQLKCNTHVGLNQIITGADFYFICVADSFISSVSKKIVPHNKESIVVHTSGSIAVEAIETDCYCKAVFYPLQTFSKTADINWKKTPILIGANNTHTFKLVNNLAKLFSKHTLQVNYTQRLNIHLAAVLVNNFTNALYVEADHQLKKLNVDFKILLPLIQQSVNKLHHLKPLEAQTGPAKRGDKAVIKKHTKLLKTDKQLKNIYNELTELIISQQTKQHA